MKFYSAVVLVVSVGTSTLSRSLSLPRTSSGRPFLVLSSSFKISSFSSRVLSNSSALSLMILEVSRSKSLPVPAGISLPMMTFSFKPSKWSTLLLTDASVKTRVVSWNDAADKNESVSTADLEILRLTS